MLIYSDAWIFRWYINNWHLNFVRKKNEWTYRSQRKKMSWSKASMDRKLWAIKVANVFSHGLKKQTKKPKNTFYRESNTSTEKRAARWCRTTGTLTGTAQVKPLSPHPAVSAVLTFMLIASWLVFLVLPLKLASLRRLTFACVLSFLEMESYTVCSLGSSFFHSAFELRPTVMEWMQRGNELQCPSFRWSN